MFALDRFVIRASLCMADNGFMLCDKTMGGAGRSIDGKRKMGGGGVTINSSPFDYLNNKKVYNDKAGLTSSMSSIYGLLLVLGIVGIVTSIMICGIRLMLAKSGNDRAEVKSALFFKCGVAILLFSGLALLGAYHVFIYKLL